MDVTEPPIRDRSTLPQSSRDVDLIAPEEITAAIRKAVSDAYGLPPDQIPATTARLLGFGRAREETRAAIEPFMQALIDRGELVQRGTVMMTA
jgi:hypothetical protein